MTFLILLFLSFITIYVNDNKDLSLKFTNPSIVGNEWYVEGFIQACNDLNIILNREYRANKPLALLLNTVKTKNSLTYLTH